MISVKVNGVPGALRIATDTTATPPQPSLIWVSGDGKDRKEWHPQRDFMQLMVGCKPGSTRMKAMVRVVKSEVATPAPAESAEEAAPISVPVAFEFGDVAGREAVLRAMETSASPSAKAPWASFRNAKTNAEKVEATAQRHGQEQESQISETHLRQLFASLKDGGLLTESESEALLQYATDTPGADANDRDGPMGQRLAVSANNVLDLLVDSETSTLRPVTPQIMNDVFAQMPFVEAAYKEKVTTPEDEIAFWETFVRSTLFFTATFFDDFRSKFQAANEHEGVAGDKTVIPRVPDLAFDRFAEVSAPGYGTRRSDADRAPTVEAPPTTTKGKKNASKEAPQQPKRSESEIIGITAQCNAGSTLALSHENATARQRQFRAPSGDDAAGAPMQELLKPSDSVLPPRVSINTPPRAGDSTGAPKRSVFDDAMKAKALATCRAVSAPGYLPTLAVPNRAHLAVAQQLLKDAGATSSPAPALAQDHVKTFQSFVVLLRLVHTEELGGAGAVPQPLLQKDKMLAAAETVAIRMRSDGFGGADHMDQMVALAKARLAAASPGTTSKKRGRT